MCQGVWFLVILAPCISTISKNNTKSMNFGGKIMLCPLLSIHDHSIFKLNNQYTKDLICQENSPRQKVDPKMGKKVSRPLINCGYNV